MPRRIASAWQPLDYTEHFTPIPASPTGDLAIEAYPWSPPQYKEPFDRLVREMNRLVAISIKRLDVILAERQRRSDRAIVAARASQNLQDLHRPGLRHHPRRRPRHRSGARSTR